MNAHPVPPVPGSTEWERSENAVGEVFSEPAEAIQTEKKRMKTGNAENNQAKKGK